MHYWNYLLTRGFCMTSILFFRNQWSRPNIKSIRWEWLRTMMALNCFSFHPIVPEVDTTLPSGFTLKRTSFHLRYMWLCKERDGQFWILVQKRKPYRTSFTGASSEHLCLQINQDHIFSISSVGFYVKDCMKVLNTKRTIEFNGY